MAGSDLPEVGHRADLPICGEVGHRAFQVGRFQARTDELVARHWWRPEEFGPADGSPGGCQGPSGADDAAL